MKFQSPTEIVWFMNVTMKACRRKTSPVSVFYGDRLVHEQEIQTQDQRADYVSVSVSYGDRLVHEQNRSACGCRDRTVRVSVSYGDRLVHELVFGLLHLVGVIMFQSPTEI